MSTAVNVTNTKELEDALNQFYSPNVDIETKRVIENCLQEIRQSENAIQFGCTILNDAKTQYALWFACSMLETGVQTKWKRCTNKEAVYHFLFEYLFQKRPDLPKMVYTKMSKVLVDIAVKDWPSQFPDYMNRVRAVCTDPSSSQRRTVGLNLLLITIEELSGSLPNVDSKRRHELRCLLRKELQGIIGITETNLANALDMNVIGNDTRVDPAVSASFEIVLQFLAMVPLNQWSQSLNSGTIDLLYRYLVLVRSPHGVQALSCINELLDKKFVPKDSKDFIYGVALRTLEILQVLACCTKEQLRLCSEGYFSQYSRLVGCFVQFHLPRVCQDPRFSLKQFTGLLIKYTYAVPGAEDFLHILELWKTFTGHFASGALNVDNQLIDELHEHMKHLIDRMLWTKNSDELELIDDDSRESVGGTINGNDMYESNRNYFLVDVFDVDETDLDRYRTHIRELVVDLAALPDASSTAGIDKLLLHVGRYMAEAHSIIISNKTSHDASSSGRFLYAAIDMRTLYSLVSLVSPMLATTPKRFVSFFEVAVKLLEWSLELCNRNEANRCEAGRRPFICLHMSILRFISSMHVWFRRVGILAQSVCGQLASDTQMLGGGADGVYDDSVKQNAQISRFVQNFDDLINQILMHVLKSLELGIELANERVLKASICLLNQIGSKVIPKQMFEYSSTKSLLVNVQELATRLKPRNRSMLYVSLSNSILAPAMAGEANNDFLQRRVLLFQDLIGRDVCSFIQTVSSIVSESERTSMSFDDSVLQRLSQYSRSFAISLIGFSELVRSVEGKQAAVKNLISSVLIECFEPALRMVAVILLSSTKVFADSETQRRSEQTVERYRLVGTTLGAARAFLDYVSQLLPVFGQQLGSKRVSEIISRVVMIFAEKSVAISLSHVDNGGTLLLLRFFRLLVSLLDRPIASVQYLLPQILQLCLYEVPGIISRMTSSQDVKDVEEAIDFLEIEYELIHQVLRHYWKKYFFVGMLVSGDTGNTMKSLEFASAETKQQYIRAMELILESFKQDGLSPNIFKSNLMILDDLNKIHRLYQQHDFKTLMRPAFLQNLLSILITHSHQLLEEELLVTIFGLAKVDFDDFFGSIMPVFVNQTALQRTGKRLSEESLSQVLSLMPSKDKDMPSFTMNLHSFSVDFNIFMSDCS